MSNDKLAPPSTATSAPVVVDVEELAIWLHNETDHPEHCPGYTWPENEHDDGRREGGFVKIVPKYAQEYFRDIARRMIAGPLSRSDASTDEPTPTRRALRALVDAVWQHATESTSVPSTITADKLITKVIIPSHDATSPVTAPEQDAVRDQIARIINPQAFDETYWMKGRMREQRFALERANQIAALSLPAHGGWEDIGTAPKDGTRVLIAEDDVWMAVARYWPCNSYWIEDAASGMKLNPPTHWRPISTPIPRKERGGVES